MGVTVLGIQHRVALRKESVDRNARKIRPVAPDISSLSARRAWIEISDMSDAWHRFVVALRKESVDRNLELLPWGAGGAGRSPQGERG